MLRWICKEFINVSILQNPCDIFSPCWAFEKINVLNARALDFILFRIACVMVPKMHESSRIRLNVLNVEPVNKQIKWRMLYFAWGEATYQIISHTTSQLSTKKRLGTIMIRWTWEKMQMQTMLSLLDQQHQQGTSQQSVVILKVFWWPIAVK